MSEVNHHFRDLIAEYYMRRKYHLHEKLVQIKPLTSNIKYRVTVSAQSSIQISADRITFISADEAAQLLRNFGSIITKLELNGAHSNGVVMLKIGNLVNTYCADTLNEITVERLTGTILVNWVKSFESIQSVTITNVRDTDNIGLNRLFPLMNRLEVKLTYSPPDSTFLRYRFEHLTELKLTLGQYNYDPAIQQILLLNHQISRFYSDNFLTAPTAHFISVHLPNLRSLSLASHPFQIYGYTENPIYFPNVTEFALTLFNSDQDRPDTFPFIFDRLESISLFSQHLSDEWIEFIVANRHLNTVAMPWTKLTYQQLTTLIEALADLNEINNACFTNDENVHDNGILRIMNEANQVNVVKCSLSIVHDLDIFLENIPRTWNLVENWSDDQEIAHVTLNRLFSE